MSSDQPDVLTEIVAIVKDAFTASGITADVTTDDVTFESEFPCVKVLLADAPQDRDAGERTLYSIVVDFHIYTRTADRVVVSHRISHALHNALRVRNFRRIAYWPTPMISLTGNSASARSGIINANVYTVFARYTARWDETERTFYRR